jgi:KipI family sensor histidine kinase inhibitor
MTIPSMSFFLMGENAAVMQPISPIFYSPKTTINIDCQRRIWSAAKILKQQPCCIDIVPGMNNLTAIFNPLQTSAKDMLIRLQDAWDTAKSDAFEARTINIPVQYGGEFGPDIAHVAKHTGLSVKEVITQHSQAQYIVYFLGFQPGFAYMGGLPEALATPRRAEPRLQVPAGAVGIGGNQTGIYPAASPGGWQLIGRSDICLFNPLDDIPSLLTPGDKVRFVSRHE